MVIKKMFLIMTALLMNLFLLMGCDSGIRFDIRYDKMTSFGTKEIAGETTMNTLELVSSLQELKDLCDEWHNDAFQENSTDYSSELSVIIRSFDEDFFSEKSLVIYSFDRGHRWETQIRSIEIDESILIVKTQLVSKEGTFTSEAFNWLMLIEVNKLDIIDVTSIRVEDK